MQKLLLIVSLLLIACPATARMYQWVNPASGRTQMSGNPPAWYRADTAGNPDRRAPRVMVFENGQLIDDTAIAVSEERRQQLREQAFRGAELEAHVAAAAQPGAADTIAAPTASGAGENGKGDFSEAVPTGPATDTAPASTDDTIAKLKALVEQWDKQKTEQAKSLIQQQPAPAPAPPASP